MAEEGNDKLGSIPAIKPGQDDALYRRSGQREAPRQSNFNGLLVFVILMMVIMMGYGGYILWEVQQKLDQANLLLAKGQENTQDLENRLAATGTDVSKTLQDMQSQIRENFKQIDLLWEHAYRTNKPNIAKNTNAIVGIRKQLDNELEPLTQSVRSVESRFTSLLDDVARTQQELRDDSEEMTTQVALIRGQVQDQFSNVTRNSRNIDSLNKELSEAQEAIDAIDTYRRQINLRIVDLQKQIQVQAPPTQ